MMKDLDVSTKEFLVPFFGEGMVRTRTFSDRGEGFGKNDCFYLNQYSQKIEKFKNLNTNKKEGIFFVVNAGGHKDGEIKKITAQFVESDHLSLEDQYQNLMNFVLEPSIIVRTRKSLHGYWLIKNGEIKKFTEIQKALAQFFQGDPVIKNLSRVMRLPGFYHQKKEPVMVGCIQFHPEYCYTQEELLNALQASTAPLLSKPVVIKIKAVSTAPVFLPELRLPKTLEGGNYFSYCIETAIAQCHFFKFCQNNQKTLPEPLWYGMISNLSHCKNAGDFIHHLSQNYSGYLFEKTELKIKQSLKTQPLRCETLKEWGFVCPILESCFCEHPWEKGMPSLPSWYKKNKDHLQFFPGILADHLKKTKHLLYSTEAYFVYKKGVYHLVDAKICLNLIRYYCDPKHVWARQLNDVLMQWTLQVLVENDCLDQRKEVINLKNGLFHLKTQTLLAHDPKYLSIVQLEVSYEKEATCSRFLSFLNDCLDAQMHPLLQEIFGYLLIPETKAQKAFIFVGEGGVGKSTLLNVIQNALLGQKNVSNISWQGLGVRFGTSELHGKLANIFADLPTKPIDDDDLFKSITGEDSISAERKHKNMFTFLPKARLLFSCNEIPKNLGDRSSAFFRRLVIIPFLRAKPEEKRDMHLKDQLKKEASGILNWALIGLERLEKNHFLFSNAEKSQEALKDYQLSSSSVLSFIDESCVLEEETETGASLLFSMYQSYTEINGLKAVSQKRFGNELKNISQIIRKKDARSRRFFYVGIRAIKEEEF